MRLWHGRGVLAEHGLTAATPRARQPPTQGGAGPAARAATVETPVVVAAKANGPPAVEAVAAGRSPKFSSAR
jgi:hypothetical protein